MIIASDERIQVPLRGERPERIRAAAIPAIREALQILNAAARLEDTHYAGRRTLRAIERRRRTYYVDTGSEYWIAFRWRVHDAIDVRLIRLRGTSVGWGFRR